MNYKTLKLNNMIEITTKEPEIEQLFLNDIAQGDWAIKLDKNDFKEVSNRHKPIIAVKVEDDKSMAELATIAFEEIKKAGCEPASFIVTLSFRQDDELMMQEMAGLNDCFFTFIDKDTKQKWGVQSLADMPHKRRITIIAFAQSLQPQKEEERTKQKSLFEKWSSKLSLRNIAKTTGKLLLFICLDIITLIGVVYFERNHIYRCGVWWEKIEAFVHSDAD